MIRCRVCKESKHRSQFYKASVNRAGTLGECSECTRLRVKRNREKNLEYYKEYDAKRYQEDPRVKERHARYQSTPEGKAAMNRSRDKWLDANRHKRLAHHAVNNAVRDGKLAKPDTCQKCGAKPPRIEGHHRDYSKPLDVVWLCRQCHVSEHRSMIA